MTVYETLCENRKKYPTPMSEEQLGQLLNETAWTHRAELFGLLEKPDGVSCPQPGTGIRVSRDILALPNGHIYDCLEDAEGQAIPQWNSGEPVDPARWTPPVDGEGNSGGGNSGRYDENKSVQFGTGCNEALAEASATPDGGMISVHSQRCAYDYYVGGMDWDECYKKHINAFRAEYGLSPL